LKILFIAPAASIHTIRWVERAKGIGVETVVYAYDGAVADTIRPVVSRSEIERDGTKNPIFNLIREIRFLKEVIYTEKPDIIHLHWLFSPTALALSFIKDQKIIATPWGSDILYTNEKIHWGLKQKLIYKYTLRKIIKNIDYFTCDADHLKERLIDLGAREDDIEILYFGTDVKVFSPSKRSQPLRNQWNVKETDVTILSNRNFYPVYDVATLIKAFKIVHDLSPNTKLILGGTGSELENLKKLVTSLNLNSFVVFLGPLKDSEFQECVASADIYVSTSTSDGGLASSVAEAMASGLPVIVTEFGENAKWLDFNANGYAFQIGNDKQLAELIIDLVKRPSVRYKMGASGRDTIIHKLNSTSETIKLEKIYKALISNNAKKI